MTMRGARRQRREQLAELQGQMAEALADVSCSCGNVYEGRSAFQVHREDLGRGRVECLPGDARGQLVKLEDGRWGQRWRHPEIR